jgi:hypothetical protein
MQYHSRSPAVLLLVLPLFLVGCSKPAGVSYEATALHRDDGGKVLEGATVGPIAARVSSMSEVEVQGKRATVQVKAIDRDKATFEITYPDGASERVEMRPGESKDFFPNRKEFGVRIRVRATDS